jgi:hypothetical protein
MVIIKNSNTILLTKLYEFNPKMYSLFYFKRPYFFMRNSSIVISFIVLIASALLLSMCAEKSGGEGEEKKPEDSIPDSGKSPIGGLVAIKPINEVNIFLENSGSINGYLTGSSEFNQALNLVLHNAELEFTLNTAYVNTQVYPSKKTLSTFVNDLTPTGIKVGDQTTSNINYMFEEAIKATSNGSVSILVSDGIYSLPTLNTTQEVITALDAAKLETRNTLINVIQKRNLMTVVIKLSSNFNGTYYKADHSNIALNNQRPYYMWIFGSPELVEKAMKAIEVENLPGYKNQVKFFRTNDLKIPHTILTTGEEKIGTFRKPSGKNGLMSEVEDAERSDRTGTKNQFGFGLAVDMSKINLPDNYKTAVANYKVVSDKNSYTVTGIKSESQFGPNSRNYILSMTGFNPTHIIQIKSSTTFLGELKISLINQDPSWISQSSIIDETTINANQTFGFSSLMEGISAAYKRLNDSDEYYSIDLTVNY